MLRGKKARQDISEAGGITIDPIRTREAFQRMTDHGPFQRGRQAFGRLDGYHVCNLACTLFGLGWLAISRDKLLYLDRLPASAWLIHLRAAPPAGPEARV